MNTKKRIIYIVLSLSVAGIFVSCQNRQTEAGTEAKTEISIDFSSSNGKVKPLHGVNNGPLVLGVNADLNVYHSEAGFPYTRLHDPRWPSPDVVDIPVIFPDFDADPDDSSNYHFKKTDDYIAPIIANKSAIIYRLGTSIEHHTQYYIHPPANFDKWTKICINIIRHYNEGWADGFHYNIKYWEIWNEPDLNARMWLGTKEDYFRLYETAAKAIKKHDPTLKVGGPATTGVKSPIVEPFLAYCRDHSAPLDFFSWHSYGTIPHQIALDSRYIRSLLDEFGFTKTENHLNEWHYLTSWEEVGPPKEEVEKYKDMREKFAKTVGPVGAAYTAAVLMHLQDYPLDVANYYSADTNPYGMFDVFGAPSKTYYVFKAFNQLAKMDIRVDCTVSPANDSVICCAGVSESDKKGVFLVSNYSPDGKSYLLSFKNLPATVSTVQYEIYRIDDTKDLELIENKQIKPDNSINLNLPPYSVSMVVLKEI